MRPRGSVQWGTVPPLSLLWSKAPKKMVGEVPPTSREKEEEGAVSGPGEPGTHVEATVDGFSKPDVFLVLALAAPPVLLGNIRWVGVDAGLARLHVAENLHGVQGAALVGVNPVVSCRRRKQDPIGAQTGTYSREGRACPGETERLPRTQGREAQTVRVSCGQKEGRCTNP